MASRWNILEQPMTQFPRNVGFMPGPVPPEWIIDATIRSILSPRTEAA